jgi:hypothetical protein
VAGRVTLSPNGGSLPAEGINVSCALVKTATRRSTEDGLAGPTDDSRAFENEINELLDLESNLRYPLDSFPLQSKPIRRKASRLSIASSAMERGPSARPPVESTLHSI